MKERSPKNLIFLILIVALLLASVIAAFVLLRTDSIEDRINKKQFINILFTAHNKENLVFIEVFLYNPETKKGAIFHFPNETWLMLESQNRYDRIQTLYAPRNPRPLIEKIERVIDVKIPYFIDIDLEKLGEIVDLVGGLELFIPEAVNKQVEGRLFLMESGSVVLDGDKAKDFLALDPADDSEMEKAVHKQDFLKAFLERINQTTLSGFLRKAETFAFFRDAMTTNLSGLELSSLLAELPNLKSESLLYRRVHGTMRDGDNGRIFIPNDQGDQLKQTTNKAVQFLRDSNQLRPEDLIVNIEILNGTEIAFRARDTSRIYRKYGYEVIREDNAPEKPVEKTVIIDRRGNQKLAREIGAVIKCANIATDVEETSSADITIILGKDFDGQYCK